MKSWPVAILALALAASRVAAQGCPQAAAAQVAAGWRDYGANEVARAAQQFQAALRRCPGDLAAETGLGYVALRRGELAVARQRFDAVLARAPEVVDALVGRGLAAERAGNARAARRDLERALALQPNHAEAAAALARLPVPVAPVQRPPLLRPDTTEYPARVNGSRFEVRTATGWQPFYIKGMNLGAALPGRYPSEFPDSATYAAWLEQMGAMGVNAVRVYTIHPPHFYQALLAHNTAHPDAPLRLVHGVWAELPPRHDFDDPKWKADYYAEIRRVVDVLHGRADVEARSGHAHGAYTADVSAWVLAFIIGREFEPFALQAFNRLRARRTAFAGTYLRVARATPADVWLAEACDALVSYEMQRYHAQHPIAYTSWPTTDPLRHSTETTLARELTLRRARGETGIVRPLEYDNDAVGLDPELVRAAAGFPAGWFASYHAYPYYPDFMLYDSAYTRASSSEGRSNYFGYLRALKQHHADMPVVIAEYGVPASVGIAHLQPQGWHHGGHGEADMAAIDARLTREIAEAGMAGGMLFAWIDEWFKKNWLTIEFEVPEDRNRLWYNRLDAEQHYGMIAMDAQPPVAGASFAQRAAAWQQVAPLYALPGLTLRAAHDAAYLWLRVETPQPADSIDIGFDVLDPAAGDRAWPGNAPIPVGIEFLLRARADTIRLLADARANPFRLVRLTDAWRRAPLQPPAPYDLPGFFSGRLEMRYNRPFATAPNRDGLYSPLLVVPNRRRIFPDTSDVVAYGYDRGVLAQGEPPDGLAQWAPDRTALEVRIPWLLLNVTDPSSRRVLADPPGRTTGAFGSRVVAGIGIVARVRSAAGELAVPAGESGKDVAYYQWDGWEIPRWQSRPRIAVDVIRRTFQQLRPAVLQ